MPKLEDVWIRPANPADAHALALLETRLFASERISPRAFRRLLASPTARVLLADSDDGLMGYAMILIRRNSRVARLYSIGVAPEAAGHGLGHRLLRQAETEAARLGRDRLRLEVSRNNPRAIRLYRRSGYHGFGLRPNYYADGSDALRFERRLDGGAIPPIAVHDHRSG
jgi:ribosomal protein S18 acetylase RimI-like enzyme